MGILKSINIHMEEITEDKVDEGLRTTVIGHILIRDVGTGKVLVNKRDIEQKGENKEQHD